MENTVIQYAYEMNLDHREFLQIFAQIFPQGGYAYQNNQLIVECGMQRMVVSLSPSTEQNTALLSAPMTQVKFEFFYTETEIAREWMQQIMRCFQQWGIRVTLLFWKV